MPQKRQQRRQKQQTPLVSDQVSPSGMAGRCITPENGKSAPSSVTDSPERAPIMDVPMGSHASPEVATLCPMPRRAFGPSSLSSPTARKMGQMDSQVSLPGSPISREDEACLELRELLASSDNKEAYSSYHYRPLSSVSTSAGPTPSLDERPTSANGVGLITGPTPGLTPFTTPGLTPAPTPGPDEWLRNGATSPSVSPSPPIDEKQQDKTMATKPQTQKVFVGGVPQDLTQDDLRAIFNQYAPVKKAWLQRCRDPTMTQNQSVDRKHRGFGFVIFQEASALQALLGDHFARFITLSDGRRLEVKRAISSNDMVNTGPPESVKEAPRPSNPNFRMSGGMNGATSGHSPSPTPPPVAQSPCTTDPRQTQGVTQSTTFMVGNSSQAPPQALQQALQQVQIIQAPWSGIPVQGPPPRAQAQPQQAMMVAGGSSQDNRNVVPAMMQRSMSTPTAMIVPTNNGMLTMQTMPIPASGDASQRSSPPPQSGYAVSAQVSQTSPQQNLVLTTTQAVPQQQTGWQLQVTQAPQAGAPALCGMGMNLPFEIINGMQGAMPGATGGASYAVPFVAAPPEQRGTEGWNQNVQVQEERRMSHSATPQPPTPSPSPPPPQASLRDIETALIQAMPEYYDE